MSDIDPEELTFAQLLRIFWPYAPRGRAAEGRGRKTDDILLAERIGVSYGTLLAWRAGRHIPPQKLLQRIAPSLEVEFGVPAGAWLAARDLARLNSPMETVHTVRCLRGHVKPAGSMACPECLLDNYADRKAKGYYTDIYARVQEQRRADNDLCKIPGCGEPRFSNGWCSAHWGAYRHWGDPLTNHEPVPQSGYRGVKKQRSGSTWAARLKTGGTEYYLGNYATAEQAARAYDAKVIEMGLDKRTGKGPRPKLNFP